jgi:hypothetical protein
MGYPQPVHRDEAAMNGAQTDLQGSAGARGSNLGTFREESLQIRCFEKLWIAPNGEGAFRLKLSNVP